MPDLVGSLSRKLYGLGPALCLGASIVSQLIPYSQIGLPQTVLSDALLAAAFGWGLVNALRRQRLGALRSWPAVSVLLGIGLAIVSALGSPNPFSSAVGLGRVVEIFLIGPLAFLLVIRRRADLLVVIGAFAVLYLGQSLVGVIQTATGTGALIGGKPIRAVGTFGPGLIGTLATMSVSGSAIMLAGLLAYHGRKRLYFLAGLVLCYAGVFASMGRAAMISASLIAFILLTKINARRAMIVTASFAVAAGLTITFAANSDSQIATRIMSVVSAGSGEADQSGIDRLSLWQASRHMIDDRPVLGVSPRQFQAHRDTYAPLALLGSSDVGLNGTFQRVALLSPHNLFYLLATEFGLPAALSILFPILACIVIGADRIRRASRENSLAIMTGLMSVGLAANVVSDGMFGDLGGPASLNITWSLGFAAWWAAHRPEMLARYRLRRMSGPWWTYPPQPKGRVEEPW